MIEPDDTKGDLRKLLEYVYKDELADYCDQIDAQYPRFDEEEDLRRIENSAAINDNHIFGAIVRLGRRYLGWN